MAEQTRRTDPAIEWEHFLDKEGHRFNFFQAVRVLERCFPFCRPVGGDAPPFEEVVRFRSQFLLSFPPTAISKIKPAKGDKPTEMTVNFMGLTGPKGVLPLHYTELLLQRIYGRDGNQKGPDYTLRDFLDLFNHRLISLFYRAWEKYRAPIVYERSAVNRAEFSPFSLVLFDLIGLGTIGLRGRMEVDDASLLFYVGLLGQHPRSASALTGVLQDYFQVPVEVIQFVGQWLHLPQEDRTRLGLTEANNRLGVDAVVGDRVWNQQTKFRLRIGPLTFTEFCQFLPGGDAFHPLVQLTQFIAGQEYEFDIQLVLNKDDVKDNVPLCRLGETGDYAPCLGYSTWLKVQKFVRPVDDTVLTEWLTSKEAT